jgi:dihydroxyacetone kinase-like predicted kinase
MLAYDPDGEVDANLLSMTKAAENVSTGQVTFAARDSEFGGNSIKNGEILALDGGKVAFVDKEIEHATVKLARQLAAARHSAGLETAFVTVMYGEDVTEDEAEAVGAAIRQRLGDEVEVSVLNGGQPVYYYILSVE